MVFIAFKGTTHVVFPNICEDPCWYSINCTCKEKTIQAKVEAD